MHADIPTRPEAADALSVLDAGGESPAERADALATLRAYFAGLERPDAQRDLLMRIEARLAPPPTPLLGWLRGMAPRDLIILVVLVAGMLGIQLRMPDLSALPPPPAAPAPVLEAT